MVVKFDGDGDPIIRFDYGFTGPRRAASVQKSPLDVKIGDRVRSGGHHGMVVKFDGDGDPIIRFDYGFTGPRRAASVQKSPLEDAERKAAKEKALNKKLDLLPRMPLMISPITIPKNDTCFEAITVYCDSENIAKSLESKSGTAKLVQEFGYPVERFSDGC